MRDVRAKADGLGLYCHTSVSSPNPCGYKGSAAELVDRLRGKIERAAACGWRELHSNLGGPEERMGRPAPWVRQLDATRELLAGLAPVLRGHGCRIDLETHGDATTWELVRLADAVGADVVGICLDTANVLLYEDPVAAARRAAPYTHLTHAKDGLLFLNDRGLMRQGRPPGEGVLDWRQILPILAVHEPELPLSIEDHKWLFDAAFYEASYRATLPDLDAAELAALFRLAWDCEKRLRSGVLPAPAAYEAIPFTEQLESRLASGRDYLKGLVDELGLRGRGH
jgi:sugar phosphate isomerase/epimerase